MMHTNVLLAQEMRGAQDTNRELVATGSRILALCEAGGSKPAARVVDLTVLRSNSRGPSVGRHRRPPACSTPAARCTTIRRPRRRASAGPQTRASQTRHRRWYRRPQRKTTRRGTRWATRQALWEQASPDCRCCSALIHCSHRVWMWGLAVCPVRPTHPRTFWVPPPLSLVSSQVFNVLADPPSRYTYPP